MFKAIALCAGLVLAPVASVAQESVFPTHEALIDRMVTLMSRRAIADLMIEFGGSDELTEAELKNLEARVRQLYVRDFSKHELIRSQTHENGWRQEMYAFYNDVDYIYTYVLIHERGDKTVAVNFRFNSAFDQVHSAF